MRYLFPLVLLAAPCLHSVEIPEPENLARALAANDAGINGPAFLDEMEKGQQDFSRYTPIVVRELNARVRPKPGQSKTGIEIVYYLRIARGIGARNAKELVPPVSPYVTIDRFESDWTVGSAVAALANMGPAGTDALKAALPQCTGKNTSAVPFFITRVRHYDALPLIPDFVKLLVANPENADVERSVLLALEEIGLIDDSVAQTLATRARTVNDPERRERFWKTIARTATDIRPFSNDFIQARIKSTGKVSHWNYTTLLVQDPDNPRVVQYAREQMQVTPLEFNTVADTASIYLSPAMEPLVEEIARGKIATQPDTPDNQKQRLQERAAALLLLAKKKPDLVRAAAPALLNSTDWFTQSHAMQACVQSGNTDPVIRQRATELIAKVTESRRENDMLWMTKSSVWAWSHAALQHPQELWKAISPDEKYLDSLFCAEALAALPPSPEIIKAADAFLATNSPRVDLNVNVHGLLYCWNANNSDHVAAFRKAFQTGGVPQSLCFSWMINSPQLARALKTELQEYIKKDRSRWRWTAINLLRRMEKPD